MVLLDLNWTFIDQRPQPFVYEVPITNVTVPANATQLVVYMGCQVAPPVEAFARNGRVYGPNDEFDQAAFNPGRSPCGELTLTFKGPHQGIWRLVFVADQFYPQGKHVIHVNAKAIFGHE